MVNIVDIEFIIDASDDTIAAINAANTKPVTPAGINLISSPYVLSDCPSKVALEITPSCAKIKAAIPGITTMNGIKNFNAAANAKPFWASSRLSAPKAR